MQFLKTQASEPAFQASNIKSQCTPDTKVYTEEKFSIKKIYERLKTLIISFSIKVTLNLDFMPTHKTCIVYTFSYISRTAQVYIILKI